MTGTTCYSCYVTSGFSSAMKFSKTIELPIGKNIPVPHSSSHRVVVSTLSLFLFTALSLCLLKSTNYSAILPSSKIDQGSGDEECDIFRGKWVPHPQGPYYTNETCGLIIDQHNCIKFGRPDTEFMNWRWKPDDCELPYFSAQQFLERVKGKSMAFVGDSVGRNQMQSLLCLLSGAALAEDVSDKNSSHPDYFKRWFYKDYNFTLATLWAPYLVKSRDADPEGHSFNSLMNLYLDEADEAWSGQIESFDYVIISAGQWFFRPVYLYQQGKLVGCVSCNENNVTDISRYYAYRVAFRTAFTKLLRLQNYKGVTFLRTVSPAHFENGDWDKGGNCPRTRPFTSNETRLQQFNLDFYLTQLQEFRTAKEQGASRGLTFHLIDTTEIMWLRPDGHPDRFGRSPHKNTTVNDCVHWCLPGPVDTWNEFLLYLMNKEAFLMKTNAY